MTEPPTRTPSADLLSRLSGSNLLSRLSGSKLGARLEVPVDEERLAESWSVIAARLRAGERSWRPPPVMLGALVVAAAAIALVVLRPAAPAGALLTATGASLDPVIHAPALALADGSEITLVGDAVLETLESSSVRVAFALREGRAHFSITPGGPRRWSVEAGAVSVEVVGTVFSVDRSEDAVVVEVERGRVLVRGEGVPDGVRTLGAGESIRIEHRIVETPVLVAPPPPTPTLAEPPVARAPRTASPRRDAESLLADADEARRNGRIDEALEILAEAAALDGDPSAPLASLTRGRVLLDRGRSREAVSDLRRALRDGLPPTLAGAALVRLVEALVASGDRAGAEAEAETWLRAHPDDERRARIEELLR